MIFQQLFVSCRLKVSVSSVFFLFALQLTVFLISLALPQHINTESSFQSENIQFLLVILQPSQKQKPRDALFVHLS